MTPYLLILLLHKIMYKYQCLTHCELQRGIYSSFEVKLIKINTCLPKNGQSL